MLRGHAPCMNEPQQIRTELHPRLIVERADEAIAFYEAAFGAELIERFAQPDGLVVHAALRVGASILSLAEQLPAWKPLAPSAIGGSPVLVHITLPDPDAACARMVERGLAQTQTAATKASS
jgi:uncharacterized glyoxalase superfamily protein PhnB